MNALDGRGGTVKRALWASLVGTSIEFYDFYVYATAASLVFGELFFSGAPKGIQQLAAFATLGVAFIARPLGSVFLAISATGSAASRRWSPPSSPWACPPCWSGCCPPTPRRAGGRR